MNALRTGRITACSADPERKFIFCATCYIDEPIALVDARGSDEKLYYYCNPPLKLHNSEVEALT